MSAAPEYLESDFDREEIGKCAGIETGLALCTCSEEGQALGIKVAMQFRKEGQRRRSENGVEARSRDALQTDRVASELLFEVFGCC